MNNPVVRRAVLDLLVDDSFALSEVVSRVQQENPQMSLPEARTVARDTVVGMFELGLVKVSHLADPHDAEVTLDVSASALALKDDLAWLPSNHWRPHFRITATEAGKDAYYGEK